MTSDTGPDYRRVMDLIRSGIESGDYPVGTMIPSTTELKTLAGLSVTSVRRGVQQLQADGVLEGHPGKGVFVRATPQDAAREQADLKALGEQVAELKEQVRGMPALLAKVNLMEAVVISLCKRLGVEYPHGGAHDTTEKAPRRGRAAR